MRVVRDVKDFRIFFVNAVTFRLQVHQFAVKFDDFAKRVAELADMDVAAEFLAQIVARKNQRAAGVFLFAYCRKDSPRN